MSRLTLLAYCRGSKTYRRNEEIQAFLTESIDRLVASAEKEGAEEHEQALEPRIDISLMHLNEESCTTIEQVLPLLPDQHMHSHPSDSVLNIDMRVASAR